MSRKKKLVTVVIPAYNEGKTIASCIKSVLSQDYRPLEVIVIDDGSRDGTARIARGFRGVKTIRHRENEGLASSLNDGIERAKGEFVLSLHADCEIVGRDWIKRAVGHFSRDKTVAVISGRPEFSKGGDNAGFVDRTFTVLRMQFLDGAVGGLEDIPFFEDKCDVYERRAIVSAGGFPSSRFRISGEDQIVSYSLRKAGYRIVRDNSLPFIQRHGTAASTFLKNLEREWLYGKTQAGITMRFGLFQLNGGDSSRMKTRIQYRVSKILFAVLFPLLAAVPGQSGAALVLLLLRCLSFLWMAGKSRMRLGVAESAVLPLVGVLTDFVYSLGFGLGLLLYLAGKRL